MKHHLHLILLSIVLFAGSLQAFDHNYGHWDAFLKQHISVHQGGQVTRVDYAGVKQDIVKLNAILSQFSAVSTKEFNGWTAKQKMAFLINAYNAFTWKLVADHYPVKTIKDIGGWRGPWKENFFTLLDDKRHLDWVEHSMLRKYFPEPRIHFAVNCASIGCPPLRDEAFTAAKLETQLKEQTHLFLTNTQENRWDPKKNELHVSKIFDWFQEDFGGSEEKLVEWLKPRFPGLETVNADKVDVDYTEYDWSLNKQ